MVEADGAAQHRHVAALDDLETWMVLLDLDDGVTGGLSTRVEGSALAKTDFEACAKWGIVNHPNDCTHNIDRLAHHMYIVSDRHDLNVIGHGTVVVEASSTDAEETHATDTTLPHTVTTDNSVNQLALIEDKQQRRDRVAEVGETPEVRKGLHGEKLVESLGPAQGVEGVGGVDLGRNP